LGAKQAQFRYLLIEHNSRAMIESVVRRAKRLALKRFIQTGVKGIKLDDLLRRCGRSSRKTTRLIVATRGATSPCDATS